MATMTRCQALCSSGKTCSRRGKFEMSGKFFCGTHKKLLEKLRSEKADGKMDDICGLLNVTDGSSITRKKVTIWNEMVRGIVYWFDNDGNIYDPYQVYKGIYDNVNTIGKYTRSEDGDYVLKFTAS